MSDECRFDRHGLCVKHPRIVDGPIVLEGAPPMLCDVAAAALGDAYAKSLAEAMDAAAKQNAALQADLWKVNEEYADLLLKMDASLNERERAILQENVKLQARVRELVAANEHWHTRVEQMKQQVEASEARVQELKGQLEVWRDWYAKCNEARTRAEATVGRMREALEYYAGYEVYEAERDDNDRWLPPPVMEDKGVIAQAALTEAQIEPIEELHDWRAEATRLAVKVEDLEHEVGTLKEKLRRVWGYINSVVPHGNVT